MSKGLWKELNGKFGYKFFSGTPFKEAASLYRSIDGELVQYVPAVNELVALRMATGARLSGLKAGIFADSQKVGRLDLGLNYKLGIPVLIVTSKGDALPKGLYSNDSLEKVVAYIDKNDKPAAFLL